MSDIKDDDSWGFESDEPGGSNAAASSSRPVLSSTKGPKLDNRNLDAGTRFDENSDWGFDGMGATKHTTQKSVTSPSSRLSKLAIEGGDAWGFEEDSSVESLRSTPLGSAVARLGAENARLLLEEGHEAHLLDYKSNNLLHLIANPVLNNDGARAFRSWAELVGATTNVVNLLLKAGVNPEARNKEDGTPTPLLSTVDKDLLGGRAWAEGHVIVALLTADVNVNANANAIPTSPDGRGWILHRWVGTDARTTRFPEAYSIVLDAIISHTEDLNANSGGRTAIHEVLRMSMELSQTTETIRSLINTSHLHPADINAADSVGDTPLLQILSHRSVTETIDLAEFLVGAGARADIVSTRGKTAISAVCDSQYRVDEDDAKIIKFLVGITSGLDIGCEPDHTKLIDVTPTLILADAAFRGRISTVEFLLQHGMENRAGETVEYKVKASFAGISRGRHVLSGTVMDMAFFGALNARKSFLTSMSRYKTEEEQGKATDQLYQPISVYNVEYLYNKYQSENAKAAYWEYPRVIRMLLHHGFRRVRPKPPKEEPISWVRKAEMQPHREHWKTLDQNWEQDASEDIMDFDLALESLARDISEGMAGSPIV
ncbi:hypothetical protein MMC17_001699 [Xylographa soralifera]|nr:hypothetical protein [Xylographa soralifera]